MKRIAMSLAALALAASAASADKVSENLPGEFGEGVLDCSSAVLLTCGGAGSGTNGPGGTVALYGCTTLDYDGISEFVYEICVGGPGDLTVDMTYAHSSYNDLDLFVLGSCDPSDCLDFDAATSGFETVTIPGAGAGTYYAVVDGWAGRADGTPHDLTVRCSAPCNTPVEETTWGAVKSIYADN